MDYEQGMADKYPRTNIRDLPNAWISDVFTPVNCTKKEGKLLTTIHQQICKRLAEELHVNLPKWIEITDEPDTWPQRDTRVVIALYEPDYGFHRIRTHRALARKGPPEQATHWRPLCDLDYPPIEEK